MQGRRAVPIELTRDEQSWLEKLTRTHTALQKDVVRAKIVLKAAKGWANVKIAQQLEIDVQVVRKWRNRFAKQRLAGLNDLPRSGAPSSFSPSGET